MEISDRTKIKLPVAAAISVVLFIGGVGTAYGVWKSAAESQQAELVRVERESKERDAVAARAIEKLQDASAKLVAMMERVDERTGMIQRDIADMKRLREHE